MRYLQIFVALMLGFTACKAPPVALQIENEKLIEVLADLHIAEEMLGKFRAEDKDSIKALYMSEIVGIHKVDTSTLFSDIKTLQENPELGLEIYSEVYSKLEKYSQEYDPTKKDK